MKKVLFVLVFIMAALVVNAQTQATTPTQVKPTITVVKIADLPKAITDNVAKDYAGFTVKDATSTITNDVLTYDVVIVNGTATETLVYDKDGKFVKKLPQPITAK